MSLLIDEHREFLQDRARIDAFARAVPDVVRPGAVVADLGSGTSILGLMACRAGASRVYCIDDSGMADPARKIARDCGVLDRITFIHGHSAHITLPERVDAIVSDIIGRIGFLAGGAAALVDTRERWLKPGGAMMPAQVSTWIAPVEHPALYAQIDFWNADVAGFDMSAVRGPAANTGYPHRFEARDLLADGAVATTCDYRVSDAQMVRGEVTFSVARAGTIHGLAVWFTAQLSPDVVMTNAPGAPDRIARRNAFLPIETPVELQAGDHVTVSLVIRPADFIVNWTVTCRRGATTLAVFRQSTLKGMLVVREDLNGAGEQDRPSLNIWAAARGTVLTLCDGRRTVREIERAVFERHRALFATEASAQIFVAEVVSRYADVPPPSLRR
jgi:protein arginine N-methyltransferase 1